MLEYPRIQVVIVIGDQVLDEEALPDTGFSGGVIVPRGYAEEIETPNQPGELVLGDDQVVTAFWWDGEVAIGDFILPTTIWALGHEVLIGREVLDCMEICFEFGERVRLRFERGTTP